MEENFFIGIDAGTTSIKGVVTDGAGNVLSISSHEYALDIQGERCEVDADVYWQKTKAVIDDLLHADNVKKSRIRALSFSSQGETLICVDTDGKPLRKAIVWLDNRSVKEAKTLEEHFGREAICKRTGQPRVQPLWPATRIMWLRENEPALFRKVHKFLLVEDYLLFRLTGRYMSEQSLVSSTLYYDIYDKAWWNEMLDYLQITEAQLPEVFPSGTSTGPLPDVAAAETGLPGHIAIVTGAYDHVAGAIGAGNYTEGTTSETTGSSMAMVVTLDKPVNNLPFNVPLQCHAVEGKYLLLPYGQTAGLVLKWFKEEFCGEEEKQAVIDSADIYDLLTAKAEKISPGADGLIMLPHLSGSGSPEFNATAKGVFAGISSGMSKAHFLRAILESIACMMKRNLDMLREAGIKVHEVRALGGGANSILWNQIKADLADVKIITVQGRETAAIGAAILSAKGAGFFPTIASAAQRMVKLNRCFKPDAERQAAYRQVYDRYVKLTNSLENFWSL